MMSFRAVGLGSILLICACSSDPEKSTAPTDTGSAIDEGVADTGTVVSDTGMDSGTIDTATAPEDTAPVDTGSPVDAGVCNTIANAGADVFTDNLAVAYPTGTFTGGTVADGTYVLTKLTQYNGPGGMTGKDTIPEKQTLVVSGTTFNTVRKTGTTAEKRFASTFSVMGAELTTTDTCPVPQTLKLDYTVTGTTLEMGFDLGPAGLVFTYEKK
jgi:hypothetical protein